MNTSNNNHLNILDLPDEILLIIIHKLNIADVFYSLVDIHERFAQLVLDPLYIRNLDMTSMTMKSFFDRTFSIDNLVLDRICENVLSRIHDQVYKLTVEQNSMERILLTVNYPQLYSLSLIDFQEEILFQYLTEGDATLRNLLTEQITHLNIDIQNETRSELSEISSNIFALILSLSKRLINLSFCKLCRYRNSSICIYELLRTSCMSSTLTKLTISVATFDDCLYLLDGRFNCLSTLIINVKEISFRRSNIRNTKKLRKLKYFSLTSVEYAFHYDDQIIPLLRRMINLEELILFLSILKIDSNYIDGIQLYDEILIYMPRLNKFTFNINTGVSIENIKVDLSSNEDIQRSFIGRRYGQVGSDVHTESMNNQGRSHVYSLSYQFEYFLYLKSCFQGGMLFDKVRCLKISDIRPFKHELFKLISQDFPFLEELYVCIIGSEEDKQQSSTLIVFPHLILLNLVDTHIYYVEQFLCDKKTEMPRLLDLCIEYKPLAMVTNNFTNDATRFNCAKLKRLHMDEPFIRTENFHQYFPLL